MPTPGLSSPVLRAVVATVVPEAAALDESEWNEVEALIARALRDRPAALRRQLRLFLGFVQWGPLLGSGRRFTALRPQERAEFLAKLANHPIAKIRLGFWGLRTLALLGFYCHPEATRAIGWTPEPRGWEALR